MFKWPSRNSGFSHEFYGGSFHSYVTNYQRVNKVKFYGKPENEDDADELTEEKLIRYLEKKIGNYKLQDRTANREIDENKYIDVKWLYERRGSRCNRCSCEFEFGIEKGMEKTVSSTVNNVIVERNDIMMILDF